MPDEVPANLVTTKWHSLTFGGFIVTASAGLKLVGGVVISTLLSVPMELIINL